MNINLISNSNEAFKLLTLMSTYNVNRIVDFRTRIAKYSETLLDVLFIDTTIYDNVKIKPFINGLSGRDGQVLCLTKLKLSFKQKAPRTQSRLVNDMIINSFLSELKDELWDQVINSFNTNDNFNLFLDTLSNILGLFSLEYILTVKIGQIIGSLKVSGYLVERKEICILNVEITGIIPKWLDIIRNIA